MKKTLLGLMGAVALLAVPVQADYYAGIGVGAGINGGTAKTQDVRSSYKDAPVYSVFAGYELPLPILDIRGETEILYMRPKAKTGDSRKLQSLMVNGIGVIPFIPLIDPYVGVGFGYARFDHTNAMAVQGILGVEYELPVAPLTVGAEYRYYKVNEETGKVSNESKFHSNILMLKAKYLF